MWALVENNAVTRVYMRPTEITTSDYVPATRYAETILWTEEDDLPEGVTISDVKHYIGDIKTEQVGSIYSRDVFTTYTTEQLEAIGIYEVVLDNSNFKNKEYYINTNQTFEFADGVVTASYGTATARAIADTLYTAQDETDGFGTEGEVGSRGLAYNHKKAINQQAGALLQETDWMVIRAAEGGTAVPSEITTWRAAVRTKANAMQVQIDGAADVDALAALYIYTYADPDDLTSARTRPLGEFPTLEG